MVLEKRIKSYALDNKNRQWTTFHQESSLEHADDKREQTLPHQITNLKNLQTFELLHILFNIA